MKRAYATIADGDVEWQIHFRTAGQGIPLVLLHPSPLSGATLTPQIELLAAQARCIAWDTPGYGASDPLPASWTEQPGLGPYVSALAAFLDALAIDKAIIYGSATGAQIAIEFAKAHPERCIGLLLENVASFTEDEIERIGDGYFPDFTPQIDGSHLQPMWEMARRTTRFFPWQSREPGAEKRSAYAPAQIVNSIFRDTLLAGKDYDRAYRAAFANEHLERLQPVPVATRIVHWQDGMLGEYGERIAQAEFPAHIQLRHAGGGMDARLATLSAAAGELITMHTGEQS